MTSVTPEIINDALDRIIRRSIISANSPPAEAWFVDPKSGERLVRIVNLEALMDVPTEDLLRAAAAQSEPELKAGDVVECIDFDGLGPRARLQPHEDYLVERVERCSGREVPTVELRGFGGAQFFARRFRLRERPAPVPPAPEFRPGDIVEVDGAGQRRFYRYVRRDDRYDLVSTDAGMMAVQPPWTIRLAFRPPAGEVWEPWNGGENPIPGACMDVAFPDGGVVRRGISDSAQWSPRCFIAYRVVEQPQEAPAPEPQALPQAKHPGWLVWNPTAGVPSFQHGTRSDAEREANRLAKKNPGVTFYILEPVHAFVAPIPEVEERSIAQVDPLSLEIPF